MKWDGTVGCPLGRLDYDYKAQQDADPHELIDAMPDADGETVIVHNNIELDAIV